MTTEPLICPRCREVIEPEERCKATRGAGTCVERQGHDGYHWTDMGRGDGVTIWTGLFSKYSCAGRLSLSDWCQKPPGHEGAHNNGRGMTFGDPHFEGCPALVDEEEKGCTCKYRPKEAKSPPKRHRWWHGIYEDVDVNGFGIVYCFRCARWLRYDDDLRRMV